MNTTTQHVNGLSQPFTLLGQQSSSFLKKKKFYIKQSDKRLEPDSYKHEEFYLNGFLIEMTKICKHCFRTYNQKR